MKMGVWYLMVINEGLTPHIGGDVNGNNIGGISMALTILQS